MLSPEVFPKLPGKAGKVLEMDRLTDWLARNQDHFDRARCLLDAERMTRLKVDQLYRELYAKELSVAREMMEP